MVKRCLLGGAKSLDIDPSPLGGFSVGSRGGIPRHRLQRDMAQ